MTTDMIPKLVVASLANSPFAANLNNALERKTNIAMILGVTDDTAQIRERFGAVTLDKPLEDIQQMLHERFGDYSIRAGHDRFLILLTGDAATKAREVAESIRVTVETVCPPLHARFHVTMHFGVTKASSHWTTVNGFLELLQTAADAIIEGERKLVANRVYGQTSQGGR